jgi:ferredoxin
LNIGTPSGCTSGLFGSCENISYICTTLKTFKLLIMAYKITEDCAACGTCADECPVEAISPGDIYKIDPELCTDCGTCADACPMGAIQPS